MGLGHCGDAYADLPPPLSRQDGKEADVINGSLSSLPMSASLSTPSSPNTNRMSSLQAAAPDNAFDMKK